MTPVPSLFRTPYPPLEPGVARAIAWWSLAATLAIVEGTVLICVALATGGA